MALELNKFVATKENQLGIEFDPSFFIEQIAKRFNPATIPYFKDYDDEGRRWRIERIIWYKKAIGVVYLVGQHTLYYQFYLELVPGVYSMNKQGLFYQVEKESRTSGKEIATFLMSDDQKSYTMFVRM